jgi:hypothetical protein
LLRVDADGTYILKVPLLIVELKQKLIPNAPDYVIPETAYDTFRTIAGEFLTSNARHALPRPMGSASPSLAETFIPRAWSWR